MGIGLETSQFSKSYTAFSGIDMAVVAYNRVLTTIQGMSYSITREKAPIYTMGSSNPRSFTRGKRGIAGSCIFTVFDRHPLNELMQQALYVAKAEEEGILDVGSLAGNLSTSAETQIRLAAGLKTPVYADQIPPFDLTLAARNEYGQAASMRVFGVEFLNEGSGTSVDDTTNEVQMTWVARHISHWKPVENEYGMLAKGGYEFLIPVGPVDNGVMLNALSTGGVSVSPLGDKPKDA